MLTRGRPVKMGENTKNTNRGAFKGMGLARKRKVRRCGPQVGAGKFRG